MNNILIVEDEHLIARLIEMTLTRAGYRCTLAEDGRTAADLIETTNFDMALLDIMLPGLDGYALLECLRPQGVPVIFITAKSAVKDRGRELCAYDVVLDTVNHTARQNGEPVELRRLEYDLLELLMRNRGAALYRDVMYERVWGGIPDTESLRTVDTHIARLRKKLGWMDKIETVYKIGYRLKKED